MLISIDKYYSIEFYNKCIQALINNKVPVKQFISTTTYRWFLDVPVPPVMLDYDTITSNEKRFLLSKAIAVYPPDQYKLYRRIDDYRHINPVMTRADYMESDDQYACFFHLRDRNDGNMLSKVTGSKIYYIGKYYGNKYRICVCTNESIRPLLSSTAVLYEKMPETTWFQAELDINYKVFMLRDYLMKFTRTPYFKDNRFDTPNFYGELQHRFFVF